MSLPDSVCKQSVPRSDPTKKVAPDLDPNCENNQKTTTATTTKKNKFVSIQKELKGNYSLIILKFGNFGLYQPDLLQAKRCSPHAF